MNGPTFVPGRGGYLMVMNLDRASSKHGPWLDDELARSDPWREPEPPVEGEPEVSRIPHGHHGFRSGDDRDPDRREERARIGSYLTRAAFPADKARLLAAAQGNHAPDEVMATLRGLPDGVRYSNAQQLWEALDLPSGPRF